MEIKSCVRCVLDESAKEIRFDERGVCNFCHEFDKHIKPLLEFVKTDTGLKRLYNLIYQIKKTGEGRKYDAILGLSGGVDSCYLAIKAKELGLRVLLVNIDMGWDTEIARTNIKRVSEYTGYELEVHKVNFDIFRELQIAFYKASIKNCEIPQDHVYQAALYKIAKDRGAKFILLGTNYQSESILPKSWGHIAADLRFIGDIYKKYSGKKLKSIPTLNFIERYLIFPYVYRIKEIRLLDYIPYKREDAKDILINTCGFIDYGNKHYESILTRFFQGYYLIRKFGIDKRKAHYSNLINSGEMNREEAVDKLKEPPYQNDDLLNRDIEYIANKLGLSRQEWLSIINLPPNEDEMFASNDVLFKIKDKLVRIMKLREKRLGF